LRVCCFKAQTCRPRTHGSPESPEIEFGPEIRWHGPRSENGSNLAIGVDHDQCPCQARVRAQGAGPCRPTDDSLVRAFVRKRETSQNSSNTALAASDPHAADGPSKGEKR
jgi:hypothetical protein